MDELEGVVRIPYHLLRPSAVNPRGAVEDTTDLQASLREHGLVEPLIVGRCEEDGYVIISGARRYTAIGVLRREDAERWSEVRCVVNPAYSSKSTAGALRAAMLAANVRRPVKPSRLGAAIRAMSLEEGWSLERCAAVLGMTPENADLHVKLLDAPEKLRARVDQGVVAWSTWKKLLARAPKDIQEQASEMPAPTASRVKSAIRNATGMDQGAMLPGEELVVKANQALAALTEVAEAPWPESVADRLRFVFTQVQEVAKWQ